MKITSPQTSGHMISYQYFRETCCLHLQCLQVEAAGSCTVLPSIDQSTQRHSWENDTLNLHLHTSQLREHCRSENRSLCEDRQLGCKADGAKTWSHHMHKVFCGISKHIVSLTRRQTKFSTLQMRAGVGWLFTYKSCIIPTQGNSRVCETVLVHWINTYGGEQVLEKCVIPC
jgi:hypothetical protein